MSNVQLTIPPVELEEFEIKTPYKRNTPKPCSEVDREKDVAERLNKIAELIDTSHCTEEEKISLLPFLAILPISSIFLVIS